LLTSVLQIAGVGVDPLFVVYGLIALVLLYVVVLRGIYLIRDDQIGIITRKILGPKMPQGQIIARKGQIGVQAHTLVPGLYYYFPFVWTVKRVPITVIGPDEVGLVESVDGLPLPKGRLLGDEVESNQFQDAEKLLDNNGFKGPQVGILRPGRYRINTFAFSVTKVPATKINSEEVGVVIAEDGQPLPSHLIIAPPPDKTKPHNFFQDGQGFLDSHGYRGPQLDTLQPGKFYINTLLFTIKNVPVAEVPPGFVAVLRSNVGEVLERADALPVTAGDNANLGETINRAEVLLTNDKNTRGILSDPISPGKYNLNVYAYTAFLVPTSAIMVDWASSDRPASPTLSRPTADPQKDESDYPYLEDKAQPGVSFFQFNQLKVTSQDGFQLEVDVRMVIRILPENAAFVIARFGGVPNLIQQIVHPLIDASFRNNAGEKEALEFVAERTQLQKEALELAKSEFEKYHVEAQNLLISYILVPQELLDTQTNKQIAQQQQTQYQEQAKAEEQRIAVQEKKARADMQPQVVAASLQIDINTNNAKALVASAAGIRDSTIIQADGQSEATRRVGEAQADAYHAQADVIGADRVAVLGAFDRLSKVQPQVITPQTLVISDGKDGGSPSGTVMTTYLATLLSTQGSKPTEPYERSKREMYESSLSKDASAAPDSTTMPSGAKKDAKKSS
jgi:regulator of protease activity HflC (stomatin/prohibitin superfamily)